MKNCGLVRTFLSLSAFFVASVAVNAANDRPTDFKPHAIQVLTIQTDEISVPEEFQVALYENLIHQLEKRGFQHVYRDGDRSASGASNLVVLHCTVRRFKAGNEMARQVITVAGATSISIHCQFTNEAGQSLLEQDVTGNVRFFGGNLRATYDFAKKASKIAYKNFLATSGSNRQYKTN